MALAHASCQSGESTRATNSTSGPTCSGRHRARLLRPTVHHLLDRPLHPAALDAPPLRQPTGVTQVRRVRGDIRRQRPQRFPVVSRRQHQKRLPDPPLQPRLATRQQRPSTARVQLVRLLPGRPDRRHRGRDAFRRAVKNQHPGRLRERLLGQVPDPLGPVRRYRHVGRRGRVQPIRFGPYPPGERARRLDVRHHRDRRRGGQLAVRPGRRRRRLPQRSPGNHRHFHVPPAADGVRLAGADGHLDDALGAGEPSRVVAVGAVGGQPAGGGVGELADGLAAERPPG